MAGQTEKLTAYVFGANLSGFHGAGSAGLMMRGTKDNNWREDLLFQGSLRELKAKIAGEDYDPELLVGPRAILGEIGLMQGREGYSYGLVTTERPGQQGCISDAVLVFEIAKMFDCAKRHPHLKFECLNFGLKRPEGFSWWSRDEIVRLWQKASIVVHPPKNVIPPPFMRKI